MSCANSSMRTGDMMAGGCLDLNVRTLRCSACFAISAFPRASTNAVHLILPLISPEVVSRLIPWTGEGLQAGKIVVDGNVE